MAVSTIDALRIRRVLGRDVWHPPIPYGPTGWRFAAPSLPAEILVSQAPQPMPGQERTDLTEWIHASMVRGAPALPSYDDLVLLKYAVWGDTGARR